MSEKEVRLGYFFARTPSGRITTVACWGDRIEKEERDEVEIIERVPPDAIEHCRNGIKILNLQRIIKTR